MMSPFLACSFSVSFEGRFFTLACVCAALCLFAEVIREKYMFTVRRYRIDCTELPTAKDAGEKHEDLLPGPIRIVFLSDLHNHTYGRENCRLIREIQRQKADLIMVGGDMLVGKRGVPFVAARSFMKEIADVAPVYCANGNHEQRMKEECHIYGNSYTEYKNALMSLGIHMLENENRRMVINGRSLAIAGLELPLQQYGHLSPAPVSASDITERIGTSSRDAFQILLAHNPAHISLYRDWGADLTLAGHLHGGLVRIPFRRGLISPQLQLFPKFSGGHTSANGKHMIVSRGLGCHTFQIRLFNTPEIVVVDLVCPACGARHAVEK